MFVFGLSNNITVPPYAPRGDYKYSVEDVRRLFLNSKSTDGETFELPGGFIVDVDSFDLRQGMTWFDNYAQIFNHYISNR